MQLGEIMQIHDQKSNVVFSIFSTGPCKGDGEVSSVFTTPLVPQTRHAKLVYEAHNWPNSGKADQTVGLAAGGTNRH